MQTKFINPRTGRIGTIESCNRNTSFIAQYSYVETKMFNSYKSAVNFLTKWGCVPMNF
jgi:hypothetical protein